MRHRSGCRRTPARSGICRIGRPNGLWPVSVSDGDQERQHAHEPAFRCACAESSTSAVPLTWLAGDHPLAPAFHPPHPTPHPSTPPAPPPLLRARPRLPPPPPLPPQSVSPVNAYTFIRMRAHARTHAHTHTVQFQ